MPSSTGPCNRALYLPRAWTEEPARLAGASVPEEVGFATKPGIAVQMIRRARAADLPFRWVAADTVYGVGDVEQVLRQAGRGYVLAVTGAQRFHSAGERPLVAGTAAAIAASRSAAEWQRLSVGSGSKGPRLQGAAAARGRGCKGPRLQGAAAA